MRIGVYLLLLSLFMPAVARAQDQGLVATLSRRDFYDRTMKFDEAVEAKVPRIWIQSGCESQAAIDLAAKSGVPLVSGHCAMMYTDPVKSVHAFHRSLARLFGSYAK